MLVFARRDLEVKYSQTILGLVWTIIQPLTGLLIFTFFFNRIVVLPEVPETGYSIFAFTGLMSWYLFSYIVYQSSTSLIENREVAQKIFFPRVILPLSKVFVALVDFSISLCLLLILMLVYGVCPNWKVFLLPLFLFFNIVSGLGISLWLSALTVKFRDLNHIVPYLVNFGIWLTPVFFPATLVPSNFTFLLYLNPMAGVVEGFRWSMSTFNEFDLNYIFGFVLSLSIFFSGLFFFKSIDDSIVDQV